MRIDTTLLPYPLDEMRAKLRGQLAHVILTFFMGWAIAALTHRPVVMVPVLVSAWMASIFMFAGKGIALWRIVAAVAANGVIFYLLARFVFPG
jgi:hypothetical protein